MEEFKTPNQLDLRQLYQQLNARRMKFVIPPASLQNGNNSNSEVQFVPAENEEQTQNPLTTYYPDGVPVEPESVQEVTDEDFNLKSYLGTPLVMPVMASSYLM